MFHAEIADTCCLYLPILNGVLHGFPGFQPLILASVWAVKQKQVDIAKTTLLHRLLDRLACGIVGRVRG